MKKIATFAFILAALSAAANLVLINVGTNADVGSATLTVPGFFTNQTYSINVTNAGTGERIGRTTWENLNNNQLLLLSLANQALATQAVAVASSRLPANLAENSATVSLFSTNNFSFANSNYWGTFSNVVWSFTTTATDLGTNQPTTNFMSFDGTTWMPWYFTNAIEPFYVTNVWTNYVGTNSLTFTNTVTNYDALPIQLSTLTAAPATGTVSIVTIDHPELIG
ncbi:MAG: hypothetical protein KGL39_56435, partial [Patescibacteria group bacterium]|nr:hypothetical protein [Patescibacteria group bacterium]